MNTHSIWERSYNDATDSYELVRPLFVGTERECMSVAPALYDICIKWAHQEWKSVCVDVLPNDGDSWIDGDLVGVDSFAWFRVQGRNHGVSGGFIWGEVSDILDAGDYLEDVRLSDNTVMFEEAFMIGNDANAVYEGSWAMDLSKCFGTAGAGLVAL